MPRVALAFAYEGTRFDSFARQPGRRTVEGEVIRALQVAGTIRGPVSSRFEVASRTDRHVSALWNVCAFDADRHPRGIVHGAKLPEGLHFLSATEATERFSPRRDATGRLYEYGVPGPRSYEWARMRIAARLFEGRHDFRRFCRLDSGVDPVAVIRRATLRVEAGWGRLRFEAARFLWEQVRRMSHAVLEVGAGRSSIPELRHRLENPSRSRPEPPADARFLLLERVETGLEFPAVSASIRRRLESLRLEHRARKRVYEALADNWPTARR